MRSSMDLSSKPGIKLIVVQSNQNTILQVMKLSVLQSSEKVMALVTNENVFFKTKARNEITGKIFYINTL